MATLNMVYKLKANATGMNMPKNQQNFFFEFRKTTRSSKYNKKFFVDEKEIPDETSVIDRKKDRNKSFIQNWVLISLLIVDLKISKTLSEQARLN